MPKSRSRGCSWLCCFCLGPIPSIRLPHSVLIEKEVHSLFATGYTRASRYPWEASLYLKSNRGGGMGGDGTERVDWEEKTEVELWVRCKNIENFKKAAMKTQGKKSDTSSNNELIEQVVFIYWGGTPTAKVKKNPTVSRCIEGNQGKEKKLCNYILIENESKWIVWQPSLHLLPKNNITTINNLVRNKNYLRMLIKWQFVFVLNTLFGRHQRFIVWHISSQRQPAI